MLAFYLDYDGQNGQQQLAQKDRRADECCDSGSVPSQVEMAEFEHRCFPDGETYFRINSDVKDQDVFVVCQLHHPNHKTVDLDVSE